MPAAIPLVASAFSISAGIAAGASTLVGGLMIASGALTGIGALTGNKKLSMLGGIIGLGAAGVGMLGGSTAAAGASAAEAAATEAATHGAYTQAAGWGKDTLTAMGAETAMGTAGEAINQASAAGTGGGILDSAMGAGLQPPAAPAAADAGVSSAKFGLDNNPMDRVAGTTSSLAGPDNPASWWDRVSGAAGKVVDWTKANPEITKAGAGLVEGAMKYYGDQEAEDEKMKRAMKYRDWVSQRYSDSVRNLQVPVPVLNNSQGAGIIGAART